MSIRTFCESELQALRTRPTTAPRPERETKPMILQVRDIPDDLLHALKLEALAARITLREHVIAILEARTVAKPGKQK